MPKFIQPIYPIPSSYESFHLQNIELADIITEAFNQNIKDNPCSLVYNPSSSKTELHKKFDERPFLSKIISEHVNYLLKLKNKYSESNDSDIFLSDYLFHVYNYFESSKDNKQNLNVLFRNLDLNGLFDEESSKLLKFKINKHLKSL